MKTEVLISVLESLRDEAGLIREQAVVEYAQPEDSPLHSQFEWNDGEAAASFRLLQAAELIHKVHVKVENKSGQLVPVRAFVSLASDRLAGGGYRAIGDVLSDQVLHAELLKTALAELNNLQRRFNDLQELSPVFKAVTRAIKRYGKRKETDARV